MKHHPDKVTDPTERAAATARFQELSHAYHVLSDERLRRIYDQTGTVEAHELRDAADGDGRDWAAYWRDLFPPITEASVREFEAKYKGVRRCAGPPAGARPIVSLWLTAAASRCVVFEGCGALGRQDRRRRPRT